MYRLCIVYGWPSSQVCTDCAHGEFVISRPFVSSHYLCSIGCTQNDGTTCPRRKEEAHEPHCENRT